jgi:transaldolase
LIQLKLIRLKAYEWGIIDGAATNPSLIKKAADRRNGKITLKRSLKQSLDR